MGVGIDIVDIKRIKKVMDKYGERFLDRVFSFEERLLLKTRKNIHETIAGRFAAKEAFIKATGMKLPLKHIKVFQNMGRPYIDFNGKIYNGISISHERVFAVAVVIINEDV
ncbi:MAG TPA: holo-ACP synthase [Syntrophorhabdaceae bacterium]|nr:holo-ACP synthase [Syntrophorhabdaceae bacterium]